MDLSSITVSRWHWTETAWEYLTFVASLTTKVRWVRIMVEEASVQVH